MAVFQSYTFTQPYFEYIEQLAYNVISGTVTLTFDSPPSSDPADYIGKAVQGILMYNVPLNFQQYDMTLSVSGNTATLTFPINMDTNCYFQLYYQGSALPFHMFCSEDYSYETPSIWIGKDLTLL